MKIVDKSLWSQTKESCNHNSTSVKIQETSRKLKHSKQNLRCAWVSLLTKLNGFSIRRIDWREEHEIKTSFFSSESIHKLQSKAIKQKAKTKETTFVCKHLKYRLWLNSKANHPPNSENYNSSKHSSSWQDNFPSKIQR